MSKIAALPLSIRVHLHERQAPAEVLKIRRQRMAVVKKLNGLQNEQSKLRKKWYLLDSNNPEFRTCSECGEELERNYSPSEMNICDLCLLERFGDLLSDSQLDLNGKRLSVNGKWVLLSKRTKNILRNAADRVANLAKGPCRIINGMRFYGQEGSFYSRELDS